MKITVVFLSAALLAVGSHAQNAPAGKAETLPSGVVIQRSVEGAGALPAATSKVKVHYRGTLANGTEFDSSYSRGQPAVFPLDHVIPCWTLGMQRLTVGSKAKLTCPSNTAYGARGVPGVIPPDSVLTFEVELLGIEN